MVIPPIPRYLLPHSCTLSEKTASDKWGKSETVRTELKHIRIEPCRSHRLSLAADIPEVSAKMFVDAVNSFPQDISFEVGDIISFMGRDYTVTKIDFYYANGRIHHLEVIMG